MQGEKVTAGIAQPKFGATSPLPPNGKKFLGILMQIFVDQPKSGATCTQKNPMESWTTSLLLLPVNIFDKDKALKFGSARSFVSTEQ